MENPIPQKITAVFALAEDMADGLLTHQTSLGVKQNTETVLRNALATAHSAEADYGAALASKKVLTTAATVADSNTKAFLTAARAVLAQRFGAQWSAAWEPTGFPYQSTAVPRSQAERLSLLESLRIYFAANPTHENAPLNVTSGRAGSLGAALSDARSAANGGLTLAGQKRAVRDTALEALRIRMRGLVDELSQLLGPDDARWYAFGLNQPGASRLPNIPESLVLTANGAGRLLMDWADAARADRYRVWQQIVGTDEDFVAAATVNDSDATLAGLPSGATVRIQVTAANDAGESLPSETKEIVIG